MPQVTITVDGKKITCEKGTMVLQAALDAGIFIPHYCYHPALSVAGNCRMCLVEIVPKPPPNAPPGWKPPPQKPAISCATEAVDGLEVVTTTKMVKEAREGVLEFLLANHPLDCPVCDQAGECDLQDFSFQYGRANARFSEQKLVKHTKDFGPEVRLYGNRCINCTRCVRFTQEITGTGEITQVNRGDRNIVDIMPGTTFDNPLSGNVVDICPVGALVSRDFLHKARVWQLDETPSVCPHCSTGCSIFVHTRDEAIMRLKPRPNPEVNGFWMCDAGRLGYKYAHDPKRLVHFARRSAEALDAGGRERISFHEAVEAIGKALEGAGQGAWAVASAWMTNEELWLLRTLVPLERIALIARPPWKEQRFFPSFGDSERNPSLPGQHERGKLYPDGATFVIEADRNPNRTGARRILGEEAISEARLEAFLAACEDGSARAALVFSGMPDVGPPERLVAAIEKVAFSAVVDTIAGPLAHAATIIAPGAVFAEKVGTYTNGRGTTQRLGLARPTPGQARPELELLHALCVRAGKATGAFSPKRTFATVVERVPEMAGLDWDALGRASEAPRFSPHVASVVEATKVGTRPLVVGGK